MNRIGKLLGTSACAIVLLHSALASAALDAMVLVTGSKQGVFKGNSAHDPRGEVVTALAHGPTSPRDMNAALAAGKRVHEPVVLTLKLDGEANRAQWDAALAQHEPITSVEVRYFKPATTPGAAAPTYFTLLLKNAAVEKLELVPANPGDKAVYVKVSFTYQQITTTWVEGGKTAQDDWLAGT